MAFVAGYCVGPIFGIDFTIKGTVALFPVGTIAYDNKGRKWRYVKAAGAITAHNLVKAAAADDAYGGVLVGDASAAATAVLGITPLTLANGDYAWIVESGIYEDDAEVASGAIADGQPFVCDASGGATLAAATDINNARGICLVDDTDNTGTLLLY